MSAPKSMFDLTGRTALVTGGSKGLGKAMARAFAEHGADVFICSRHEDELKAAAAEIGDGLERRVEWAVADLADPPQAPKLAEDAQRRLGHIDILVNNAGTNAPQPIDEVSDENWATMMELNLTSAMRLTRALAPPMKERKWGRVIHVSSVLGLGGKEGRNGYCASKAGMVGLTRASATVGARTSLLRRWRCWDGCRHRPIVNNKKRLENVWNCFFNRG